MNKKVAIITGGTSGIGLATAIKMADNDIKVYACGRKYTEISHANIIYHYLDVTNQDSCHTLMNDVLQENDSIDILVANAGITSDALTVKMTDDQFDRVIDVNVKGVFNIVKCIGPFMERQGYGSIVIVSSIVGEQGNIGQANYAASKGAVISMMKTWAKEFTRKGANVRVNAVAPGYIMTKMLDTVPADLIEKFAAQTMLKRLGKPEEIAEVIYFLASENASYITGSVISANGGMRL